MWKLLSLFVLPLFLLAQAKDAYAVSAAIYNASPFCVCIQAKSAGGLKDGDKNCASPGKTTHSAPAGADYIRSVHFTTYATNLCSQRTKALLIKEMSGTRTFESAMGRATKVHFGAYSEMPQGSAREGKGALNFQVQKISWMRYCAHVKNLEKCEAEHEQEKEEVALAAKVPVYIVGGTLTVIGTGAMLAMSVAGAEAGGLFIGPPIAAGLATAGTRATIGAANAAGNSVK